MKKLFFIALAAFTFASCKKEVGPQGPQGNPGPDAKTFTYSLIFNPGDTYKTYSGITGFDDGDVIVTYVLNDTYVNEPYYVQTPFASSGIYYWAEVGNDEGNIFINTTNVDGSSGSPWSISASVQFKSVLIKSSGLIKNPDLDLSDYYAVKKAFDL